MKSQRVFISYSHLDRKLVSAVVSLLRASNALCFVDYDSIKPGSKWRQAIADELNSSTLVTVFWCKHSADSREVAHEYTLAIRLSKGILPVLLDTTPLPSELLEYQSISLVDLIVHHQQGNHEPSGGSAPPLPLEPAQTDRGGNALLHRVLEPFRQAPIIIFVAATLSGFLFRHPIAAIIGGSGAAALVKVRSWLKAQLAEENTCSHEGVDIYFTSQNARVTANFIEAFILRNLSEYTNSTGQ